jgi:hypothetical protein
VHAQLRMRISRVCEKVCAAGRRANAHTFARPRGGREPVAAHQNEYPTPGRLLSDRAEHLQIAQPALCTHANESTRAHTRRAYEYVG